MFFFLIFRGGHLEKEAKEIAKNILHFKRDLEVVAEYSQRPLPLIAEHALCLLFWTTMFFGTLDNTHKFLDMTQVTNDSLVFGILLVSKLLNNYFNFHACLSFRFHFHVSEN